MLAVRPLHVRRREIHYAVSIPVDAAGADLVQGCTDPRGMCKRTEAVDVYAIAGLVDIGAAVSEARQSVPLSVGGDAVLARLQQRQRIRERKLWLCDAQPLNRAFRQHPFMRQRSTAAGVCDVLGWTQRIDRLTAGRVVGPHIAELHAPVRRQSAWFDVGEEGDRIRRDYVQDFVLPRLKSAAPPRGHESGV